MEKELEALIKKALSDKSVDDKQEEKKESVLTDEERELAYKDGDEDYQRPWQRIHNK